MDYLEQSIILRARLKFIMASLEDTVNMIIFKSEEQEVNVGKDLDETMTFLFDSTMPHMNESTYKDFLGRNYLK